MVHGKLRFDVASVMSCKPLAPFTFTKLTPRNLGSPTVPMMIAGAISPDNLPQCGDVEA